MEINNSLKELETFIQTKIKPKNSQSKNDSSLGVSQSVNHFSVKETNQDFLDEMRAKGGKRSQTTRRLIRKIQNESSKGRYEFGDNMASAPNFATHDTQFEINQHIQGIFN